MVAAVMLTRVAKLPKRALHFPRNTFDHFPSGSFLAFLVPKCKYTWCRGQQHKTAYADEDDAGIRHVLIAPKDPSGQALSGFGIIARRREPWTNLLVGLVVCATEGMARQIHKR
jgi:hypothetical protein